MKKSILIILFILAQTIMVFGQEEVVVFDELKFESEIELNYWKQGQQSPYKLFRSVDVNPELKDQKWEDHLV